MLKLRTHKPVALARVGQNEEVDLEDEEVEHYRDYNETQSSSHEVADPKLGRNPYVSEEVPQLMDRAETDGSDGKQANPLAAYNSTK